MKGTGERRETATPGPPAPVAIPFIVHPIDSGVHALLNSTLRPALRRLICAEAGGALAGLQICEREGCQQAAWREHR